METKDVKVKISNNNKTAEVIMFFFEKNGPLFKCSSCAKLLRGYNFILKQHLKMKHVNLWQQYLTNLGNKMVCSRSKSDEKSSEISAPPSAGETEILDASSITPAYLKVSVLLGSADGSKMNLSMPASRQTRESLSQEERSVSETLSGFKGRIQKEFNTDPMGPYMGPYDQSEKIAMKVQLPCSELSYAECTEFRHERNIECKSFSINQSYAEFGNLDKIESLEVSLKELQDFDKEIVRYTCTKGKCRIPCICKECNFRNPQCKLHKIKHPDLFNYEKDSMTIRSSEILFQNGNFLSNSYTIRYANIPLECFQCSEDLLHHNLYHLKFHVTCKFCLQIRHKLKPSTPFELQKEQKRHRMYLNTVCPQCDRCFVDQSKRNDHVRYAHENIRIKCNMCAKTFGSNEALRHHTNVSHEEKLPDMCLICNASFTSKSSLKNHQNYAHSTEKNIECEFCEKQFKQKRDLNVHLKMTHDININDHYLNDWNNDDEKERFQCEQCSSNYKYKKDLYKHLRQTHNKSKCESDEANHCSLCNSYFKHKKSLNEHMRNKHQETEGFKCSICGKSFNQKKNCLKHERNHEEKS